MGPARRPRLGFLTTLVLFAPLPAAVTGCESGCDTTLTVTAGAAHRTGAGSVMPQIQVDLSARLTSGGKGVGGVLISFIGITPRDDSATAASAVTDADGVAHYSGPASFSFAHALDSVTTPQTFSYVARTMVLGSKPDSGICNLVTTRSQPADLRYQP